MCIVDEYRYNLRLDMVCPYLVVFDRIDCYLQSICLSALILIKCQVLEGTWNGFEHQLMNATDLDAVISAHSEYIRSIVEQVCSLCLRFCVVYITILLTLSQYYVCDTIFHLF